MANTLKLPLKRVPSGSTDSYIVDADDSFSNRLHIALSNYLTHVERGRIFLPPNRPAAADTARLILCTLSTNYDAHTAEALSHWLMWDVDTKTLEHFGSSAAASNFVSQIEPVSFTAQREKEEKS